MNNKKRIAVFFDGENVSSKFVNEIMNKLNSLGDVNIKQAYMDWTSFCGKSWDEKLALFAINPIQVRHNISSKNACDHKIVIDTMKTLYKSNIDIFAIVSSDSDFTSLAMEIKSEGKEIWGFGERKSPLSLRNAYSKFIELHLNEETQQTKPKPTLLIIQKIIDKLSIKNNEYVLVSKIGQELKAQNIYPQNYSVKTWGEYFKSNLQYFEIKFCGTSSGQMYIKNINYLK
jgi:uncharacterized protein (TIGR00288 family)